jgi:MFS family permease
LPESPRWLISKILEDKAYEILKAIRINAVTNELDEEISEIKEANVKENGGFKDLMQKWVRPALVIGIGFAVFQQLIGINTVIYYAPTIFSNIGLGENSAILSTVGIGILNVLVTILALFVMDRIDRKKMLIMGSLGMAISLSLLCIVSQFHIANNNILGYITLAFFVYIYFSLLSHGVLLCG